MAVRTPVYVVCSPLDRVGKTLIARLVAEFFIADDRYVEAFDINRSEPSLIDYLPGCTSVAAIHDIHGQMALFDRLIVNDGTTKVVDLGPEAFAQFFRIVGEVGFIEEARNSRVQFVVLFVANPGPKSLAAYGALREGLAGVPLVPVHNEGIVRGPNRQPFPSMGAASLPLRIPALAPGLHRIIAATDFSFAEFRHGRRRGVSEAYHHELDSWMKRVFVEFRELELRLLLQTLKHSLPH